MDRVVQTVYLRQTAYEKYRDNSLIQKVRVLSIQREYEGFRYMTLMNSFGEVIFDVFEYLNDHLQERTPNHRELCLNSLKVLFSFAELFYIHDYKEITKYDAMRLCSFLAGRKVKGLNITFDLKTHRGSNTFNLYASVFRDFYSFLGVPDNKNVFKHKRVALAFRSGYGMMAHTRKSKVEQYTYAEKTNKDVEVPDYISFEQYTDLLQLIDRKYSIREKIVVMLGYEHGLRISEILGLTLEDIDMKENGPVATMRNRLSDRKYQFCKNLMHPRSADDYLTSEYKTHKVGWTTQAISDHVYDYIQQYVNETRSHIIMTGNKKAMSNMVSRKADKVTDKNDIDENFYIFMGKNYTPLTSSGVNKILRKMFKEVGIAVDEETRKHNLAHKLRHGRAMFMKQTLGAKQTEISEELRHNSEASADIYFRPTVADRIKNARKGQALLDRKLGRRIR